MTNWSRSAWSASGLPALFGFDEAYQSGSKLRALQTLRAILGAVCVPYRPYCFPREIDNPPPQVQAFMEPNVS